MRPIGWIHRDRLPARDLQVADVESESPLFDRRTTLKDALSMLLDADVQAGLVVDRRGTFRGLVTLDQIVTSMRDAGRDASPPAEGSAAAVVDG